MTASAWCRFPNPSRSFRDDQELNLFGNSLLFRVREEAQYGAGSQLSVESRGGEGPDPVPLGGPAEHAACLDPCVSSPSLLLFPQFCDCKPAFHKVSRVACLLPFSAARYRAGFYCHLREV